MFKTFLYLCIYLVQKNQRTMLFQRIDFGPKCLFHRNQENTQRKFVWCGWSSYMSYATYISYTAFVNLWSNRTHFQKTNFDVRKTYAAMRSLHIYVIFQKICKSNYTLQRCFWYAIRLKLSGWCLFKRSLDLKYVKIVLRFLEFYLDFGCDSKLCSFTAALLKIFYFCGNLNFSLF